MTPRNIATTILYTILYKDEQAIFDVIPREQYSIESVIMTMNGTNYNVKTNDEGHYQTVPLTADAEIHIICKENSENSTIETAELLK